MYKLQYLLHNNYDNSQALSGIKDLQKLLFHGPAHVRAAAPSGPLSYCFGTATSGEPSTWLPLGELEGQERPPAVFFHFFADFSDKIKITQLFFTTIGAFTQQMRVSPF